MVAHIFVVGNLVVPRVGVGSFPVRCEKYPATQPKPCCGFVATLLAVTISYVMLPPPMSAKFSATLESFADRLLLAEDVIVLDR